MDFSSLIQNKFIAIVKEKTGFKEAAEKRTSNWCYVQAHPNASEKVHYELQQQDGKVFVCFFNEAHGNSYEWRSFWAKANGGKYPNLHWNWNGCIQREVASLDNLESETGKLISDLSPLLEESYGKQWPTQEQAESALSLHDFNVGIVSCSALDLLKEKLFIPDYQREYCWRPEEINSLFNDIFARHSKSSSEYHLGTIILKADKNGRYAVIDGQQRLTTLAIWQFLANASQKDEASYLLSEGLKKEDGSIRTLSQAARNALLRAKQTIGDWQKSSHVETDLSNVVLSVVVLGMEQPEDLAYTFFSNSNSTGRRLSDFDLLKSHHLRFIHDEGIAQDAVNRWHELEKNDLLEPLLHHSLFRLRNWRCGTEFNFEATSLPDCHEVYRHYSCTINEERELLMRQMQQFRFDSILPGGQAFFQYTEHYRRLFTTFRNFPIVKKLDAALEWHSNGVIHNGIKAIAFLFYCKFGASYLQEAVYALAYRLSELRNAARVMRQYINHPLFRETTSLLDRVTTVGQFLGSLLTPERVYAIDNNGRTAKFYWEALHGFLHDLERDTGMMSNREMKYSERFV